MSPNPACPAPTRGTDAGPAQPRARLPGLELLRWIAALCVLLLHASVIFGLPHVFAKGYLGVDLFFMLSGYVMARSFESRPAERQPVARFIVDRWWRMWPMMALGGAIGWPLLQARLPEWSVFLRVAVPNLLLLPVDLQHEAYPLNVPAWTIIYILLGNLLHRLVLYRLRGRWLALAIAGSAVAMAAAAAQAGSFDVGSRPENMVLAVPRLMLAYLIGMALRRSWGDTSPLPLPAPVAWALTLAGMPLLLAGAWWCGVTSWWFDMAFVIIACPLMFAGAAQLRLSARGAGFAGAWSFPLYAIHFPLLIRLRNHGLTVWPALLAALALSALATGVEIQLRAKFTKPGSRRALVAGPKPLS